MTTVAAENWPSSVASARAPSIRTSHRPLAADHVKVNEAAGHTEDVRLPGNQSFVPAGRATAAHTMGMSTK
jgi:hypothetical protein